MRNNSTENQKVEVEYENVLDYARGVVNERYGSVLAFTQHPDFREKCGFSEAEAHKISTYLSKPLEGGEKKVKSTPFLTKLMEGLTGIKVESARKVVHTIHFYVSEPLPALSATA